VTRAIAHPVLWWPARLAPACAGVVVIGVAGATSRPAARAAIRAALRDAVAQLAGVPGADVAILSEPGRAPAVSIRGMRGLPGIAISHDADLSLGAINLDGPVGVDLMRVSEIPDWRAVAHDYLGPAVTATLDATAPALRARAFAQAWTAREARLKCHGMPLAEWTPQAGHLACRDIALALPPGFAGSVAIPY
jgi:4'-phosphopantetheinyl transferase